MSNSRLRIQLIIFFAKKKLSSGEHSICFIFVVESMRNITKNVRLGFGSFVDKKTMPFVSIVPKQ